MAPAPQAEIGSVSTLLHGSAAVADEGLIGVGGNPAHNRKLSSVPFKHHAEHRRHIPKPPNPMPRPDLTAAVIDEVRVQGGMMGHGMMG
jgi:hypothetical protein